MQELGEHSTEETIIAINALGFEAQLSSRSFGVPTLASPCLEIQNGSELGPQHHDQIQ